MIKNVIFDFGGVLVDWDPRYLYRKLSSDLEKIETFLTQVCHSEWNLRMDAGHPFSEAMAERKRTHPEYSDWIDAYWARWPEMIRSEIPGTVELLQVLSNRRVPLYGLTNWSAETFPFALERFPFFSLFKGIVVSGMEKKIKPDPSFFQLLLDRYQLNPGECLFIDDVAKNIDTAQALGLKTHHFKDPGNLKRLLIQEGLL